jgi:hypothetical protein
VVEAASLKLHLVLPLPHPPRCLFAQAYAGIRDGRTVVIEVTVGCNCGKGQRLVHVCVERSKCTNTLTHIKQTMLVASSSVRQSFPDRTKLILRTRHHLLSPGQLNSAVLEYGLIEIAGIGEGEHDPHSHLTSSGPEREKGPSPGFTPGKGPGPCLALRVASRTLPEILIGRLALCLTSYTSASGIRPHFTPVKFFPDQPILNGRQKIIVHAPCPLPSPRDSRGPFCIIRLQPPTK